MIGKTIKSILAGNAALTALVPAIKMFPYVMNEDTVLPAIVYTINGLSTEYSKGGSMTDDIEFSVHSFHNSYDDLQDIVSAIRTALELNQTGSGTQDISKIILTAFEEGYDQGANAFWNKLTFNVLTNAY